MLFLSFPNTYVVVSIVGARVNAKDNKWLTPLHRAVASCSEVSTRFTVFLGDSHVHTTPGFIV